MKRIDFSAFAYDAGRGESSPKRPKVAPAGPVAPAPAQAAARDAQLSSEPMLEIKTEPAAKPKIEPELELKTDLEAAETVEPKKELEAVPAPELHIEEPKTEPEDGLNKELEDARKPEAAADSGVVAGGAPAWPGPLQPLLEPGLRYVFVGFNPGLESARQGHHYAHHSNRFWKLLHWSGLTPRKLACQEDRAMPRNYRIGFTDLVARSTKGIQQLSKQEMADGVAALDDRIGAVRPRVVCFVGKGIWEAVAKARGWDRKRFRYGLDEHNRFGHGHSLLCCVPSTSGLTSIRIEQQLAWWREVASLAPAHAAPA